MYGVRAEKFFWFYLSERGIKVNLEKCDMIINMETQTPQEHNEIEHNDDTQRYTIYSIIYVIICDCKMIQ